MLKSFEDYYDGYLAEEEDPGYVSDLRSKGSFPIEQQIIGEGKQKSL